MKRVSIVANFKWLSVKHLIKVILHENDVKIDVKAGLSHLPNKIIFICFNENPLKMMKNAFYFIVKAFFVLKIFNFLFWLFGHVKNSAWLEG